MEIKVKLFSCGGVPASDGSIIPRHVVEEYLASDQYKTDIAGKKMLGCLTHRCRNWATQNTYTPAITKTVGKSDQIITVGVAAPTHYIKKMWINEEDQWVYAEIVVLPEDGLDDQTVQEIRRLKGLTNQGILLGTSAVITAYWDSTKSGDIARRIVKIGGLDFTTSPSWKDSTAYESYDDEGNIIASLDPRHWEEKEFSLIEVDTVSIKAKTFSDSALDDKTPRSSKIDGHFTILKAKQFSSNSMAEITTENIVNEEKVFSVPQLKERVRYAKFSPRMRFRRLFLDYKQLVRQMGGAEKIDPDTMKVLKSLFATDCLDIIKTITPEVINGKQVNTLIGASSLGAGTRKAAQKLQMPLRLAMTEANKNGYVNRNRYQKVQEAYQEFIQAMIDEVFGATPIPEGLEEDITKEEETK